MRRKRVLIGIGIVLVLLVALVAALPWLVDVNRYRDRVQAELQQRLGRPVTLGRMQLSYVPLGIRVENTVIGEDPRFRTGRPFAQAEELYVSPRLLPLLRREFELDSVQLRQPSIELVRNAEGVWNFATLGREEAKPEQEEAPTLVLNELIVERGQVAITDLQKRKQRAVYQNIDLQLENFAPDRAFRVMLAATLPGEGAQRLSLRGNAGPLMREDILMTPFEGSLHLEQVSISGVQRFMEVEALQGTDSVISGSAQVRNANGRINSNGSLQMQQTRVRGLEIGYPITADYNLAHDLNTQVLSIQEGTLRLDQTPLSVTGSVNLQPEPAALDLHVTASEASLAEAARLASAFGVAFGKGTQVDGRMHADLRARGPATRPELEGNVRLRSVRISGSDIPQPVQVQAVDLALTPREIRSNDFYVATGGTSLAARLTVAQYNTETPSIDAGLRTTDAELGELINIARAWGLEAAEGVRGSGRLSLDVRASGPTGNLSYSGSGSLRDASLQTPAITQPLRIRTANLKFNRNSAVLDNLAASLGQTNAQGSMTVSNFKAPQVQFELSADKLNVAELQQVLASGGGDAKQPTQPQQQAQDSVLMRTTGAGTVRIGAIAYEQLVLNNVQSRVTLDRGLIRMEPLSAELFGGTHRGAIVVDARRSPPTFSLASNVERVDANRLVSAATNLRDALYGTLMSNVKANFVAGGANDIPRTLNGTLSLNLTEGRLAGIDLLQQVGQIAQFVTGREQGGTSTELSRLSGTFNVTNGVARTEDLQAWIEGGTVGANGTVNLVDQSLNMRVVTVLSREFSQRVGGTEIGGFMNTALANQNGELVVPVIVTGTLSQPRFAPDVQRIAEMKLQNLVPNLRNPQSLTSGILGAIGGQQQQNGRTPQKTLEGIVGAITGREKEQEQQEEQKPQESQEQSGEQPQQQPPQQNAQPQKKPAQQVRDALEGLFGKPKPEEEQKPQQQPPPPQ